MRQLTNIAILSLLTLPPARAQADWPQWNGPQRDGVYRESGVIDAIPATGLKRLWSAPIYGGYSSPAVVNDRVYVTDFKRTSGELKNDANNRNPVMGVERLVCFDASTGKELWSANWERNYNIAYASGPRATPTVDNGIVYVLGAEGDLAAFPSDNGNPIWHRQLPKEYKAETPLYGYSSHPLVVDDLLICLAGGEGSVVVGLDKRTGTEKWRALSASEIGYAPPTLIQAAGKQQLLIWDADKLNSLDPTNGKVYWSQPLKPSFGMAIMAPVRSGNKLFVSGIGDCAAMFELSTTTPGAKVLWKGDPKNAVYCANSTPIFDGDYLYGCDCRQGSLICVRASDGERMWETFEATTRGERRASHGTAFLTKVGAKYFILSETGDLIIARLTPEKYIEEGRFHVIDPTNDSFDRPVVWSYPAFSDQRLFVRNDREIICYSIAK